MPRMSGFFDYVPILYKGSHVRLNDPIHIPRSTGFTLFFLG